jgi:formate dehydrogenase
VSVTIPEKKQKRAGQIRGRSTDPIALAQIRELLGNKPRRRDLLIEHLHLIQDNYRQISAAHIVALAEEMKLATTEVFEVASFYHHFAIVKDAGTAAPEITVRVCGSISCELAGSRALAEQLAKLQGATIKLEQVPCVGRCDKAPVVVVGTNPVHNATINNVSNCINNNELECIPDKYIEYDEYLESGGYSLLQACLDGSRTTDSIIAALKDSGLRGLGGAGFPAGIKWEILRKQASPRLLAVNIDEGEPGTFKDRYYLERDPHRFLEGTLIAAWAIAAESVYLYLRDEYAGCRKILQRELEALNNNPPGALPAIHLRRGAGAYICGEESAMIESIEGKRGMPRLRPPYVAEVGLFGRPTLEHNMETLYWVRDIVERGAAWFTAEGRNGRKGLRSFSVSGRVQMPGMYLAPAGITVRELIDEYCGGMLPGHTLYGYFPGGASGGILPASLANIPLDFDTLNEYGCFIGSAAVIVLSDKDRARDAALNAMKFFEDESCGQCTPCRVGTRKAVNLMEQQRWDAPLLEELARVMEDASICGLGQAAPNALRCALKYFPEEFGHVS